MATNKKNKEQNAFTSNVVHISNGGFSLVNPNSPEGRKIIEEGQRYNRKMIGRIVFTIGLLKFMWYAFLSYLVIEIIKYNFF